MSKLNYLREALLALEEAERKVSKARLQFLHTSIEYERLDVAEDCVDSAIDYAESVLQRVESEEYSKQMHTTFEELPCTPLNLS